MAYLNDKEILFSAEVKVIQKVQGQDAVYVYEYDEVAQSLSITRENE